MKKFISLIILLTLLVSLSFSQQTKLGGRVNVGGKTNIHATASGGGADLINGLVSFWKLGEAATNSRVDSIGSNNLTETGGSVSSGTGKIGNAAVFAESSYLTIADNASLSITTSLTIIAWVKVTAGAGLDFPGIISKWENTNQRSYMLMFDRNGAFGGAANRFVCGISPDGTSASSIMASATSFGTPTNDVWYFLQCFVDLDADIVGISVDNGTINTNSYTSSSVFDGTSNLRIGNLGTADNTFNGSIDAVGLWNRRLNSTEVTCLYNAGVGQEPTFAACP